MSTEITIERTQTLTAQQLAALELEGREPKISEGVDLITGDNSITIGNLPTGVTKGEAARVIASRMVRSAISGGTPVGEIQWEKRVIPTGTQLFYTPTDHSEGDVDGSCTNTTVVSNVIPEGATDAVVTFAGTLTTIGAGTFSDHMTCLVLPDSVTSVDSMCAARGGMCSLPREFHVITSKGDFHRVETVSLNFTLGNGTQATINCSVI